MGWWTNYPWRMVQTNFREIDMADVDAEKFAQDLADYDATVVTLNAGGILASYPSDLPFHTVNSYLTGSSLKEMVEACHAKGIKVIARMDFSKIPYAVYEQHPDWAFVTAEGKIIEQNGFVQTCQNSEYQQEKVIGILEELLSTHPFDGVYCNMSGFIATDYNEKIHGFCTCENCRKAFKAATGMDVPAKMDMRDPAMMRYMGFQSAAGGKLRAKMNKAIKAINPEIALDKVDLSSDGSIFDTWITEPKKCTETCPAIMLVHGGAFYLPVSVSTLALACVYAQKMNVRVFLPEYRLVPAYPAPHAFDDCLSLWKELSDNGRGYGNDPDRLILMGESAGGAVAAGMCLFLKDSGMKLPKGLLLIYPVLDVRTETYRSARQYEDAVWPLKANAHMWAGYLKNAPEEMMKYLIPRQHEDLLGLPVTYVEPQEIDILCDEGKAFAGRLQAAGVKTELNMIPGSYHCFDSDLTSEFVQNVIEQRINAAEAMLDTE